MTLPERTARQLGFAKATMASLKLDLEHAELYPEISAVLIHQMDMRIAAFEEYCTKIDAQC